MTIAIKFKTEIPPKNMFAGPLGQQETAKLFNQHLGLKALAIPTLYSFPLMTMYPNLIPFRVCMCVHACVLCDYY